MRSSRRNFLKSAAASASFIAFPRVVDPGSHFFAEDSLEARLAADPLRPQWPVVGARHLGCKAGSQGRRPRSNRPQDESSL